ncbi:YlbD family protein [Bacillus sp. FJAT-45037]|uniref:YlbD family protein n=1 Tax=Bacillus sp. FJAT-45037 TaxID=2011007 RepID=UPI000C23EEB5|nr:YlbD family protein [Bacillus sp. FJAT-45037]
MDKHQNAHPSVEQFKQFVREHSLIIEEIKSEQKTLQQFYEEWSILGAQHEQWQAYRVQKEQTSPSEGATGASQGAKNHTNNEEATDTLGQVMNMMKRFNVQDLQNHLAQFSSVLSNVQNVMQTFQQPTTPKSRPNSDHPFSFRRD